MPILVLLCNRVPRILAYLRVVALISGLGAYFRLALKRAFATTMGFRMTAVIASFGGVPAGLRPAGKRAKCRIGGQL